MLKPKIYFENSLSSNKGSGIADFSRVFLENKAIRENIRVINQPLVKRYLRRNIKLYKYLYRVVNSSKISTIIYQIIEVQLFLLLRGNNIYLINPYHNLFLPFSKKRYVSTIHDLVYFDLPLNYKPIIRFYNQLLLKWSIKNSKIIITVSEYTSNEIIKRFKTKAEPFIIYNSYKIIDKEVNTVECHKRKDERYFLYFGGADPRKNLKVMFELYKHYRKIHASPIRLFCTKEKEDYQLILGDKFEFPNDVFFLGRISDRYLDRLIRYANGVLYLSDYEGFGRPLMEAAVYKVPTIAMDLPVYQEIPNSSIISFSSIEESSKILLKLATSKQDLNRIARYNNKFMPETNSEKILKLIHSLS